MTTPERVLDAARQELGTAEAPDGSNPYGRAYGVDRVAWCMQFVWWCFRKADAGALIHPKTAYTPTAADWHRSRGQWSTTPRVGSLVFYDWPDSVNRIQHVGIVEAVEPAAIVALEGNTSTANQSDGGRVMRRRRARNNSIVGYGHPAYPAPRPQEDDLTPEQDTMLRQIYRESTFRLKNRRGPDGTFRDEGFKDDTLLGMATNADGYGFRAERALAELTATVNRLERRPAAQLDVTAIVDAIAQQGLAPLVADELARRLSTAPKG